MIKFIKSPKITKLNQSIWSVLASSDRFCCPTISPKPKNSSFNAMNCKENQQIFDIFNLKNDQIKILSQPTDRLIVGAHVLLRAETQVRQRSH